MSKILRFSIVAALAMAATACNIIEDEGIIDCPSDFHTACLGTSRYLSCENGEFVSVDCDRGFICKSDVGRCVAEEAACTRDANCPGALVCVDGKCMTKVVCSQNSDCATDMICNDAGVCIDDPAVRCNVDGQRKCLNGTTVMICVVDTWVNSECMSGQVCNAGRCEDIRCAAGGTKCESSTIVSICTNNAWVSSECASGQTCSNGKCTGGSAPIEGAPCNTATFAEQCFDNAAYYCGPNNVVVKWNCASDDGKCLLVENDEAWCAYLDSEAYQQCDYDGQVSIWYPNWAEQYCTYDIILFDSCHIIDGEMYFIEDRFAGSVCVGDSRVVCASSSTVGTETCSGGCSFDGWDAVCVYEPCTEGEAMCIDSTTVSVCTDGLWVSSECASGQTCSNGKCTGGSAPIEGAPCNTATFAEQCFDNAAYFCGSNDVVVKRNCTSDDGKCLLVENDEAWCAYLDSEAYDQCDYDGQVSIWYPGWAEQFCGYGVIIFDSCHMIDGKMYFIEDRVAVSVCTGNNRRYCASTSSIGSQSCGSNTCSFDGWDATCVTGCTEGAKRCGDTGIPELCVSNAWVAQAACADGQKCEGGGCRAISVGDKCDPDTFADTCKEDGSLWYCDDWDDTITRLNCAAYSLACVIDDTVWGCLESCTTAGSTKTQCYDRYGWGWIFYTLKYTCSSVGGGLHYVYTDDWDCYGTCNAAGTDCM